MLYYKKVKKHREYWDAGNPLIKECSGTGDSRQYRVYLRDSTTTRKFKIEYNGQKSSGVSHIDDA